MENTKLNGAKINLICASNKITIEDSNVDLKEAYEQIDTIVDEVNLNVQDEKPVRLLVEECITMLNQVSGEYSAKIWLEKYPSECHVKLEGTTEMNHLKKKELLSISTDKKNSAVKGFLAKLAEAIIEFSYDYEEEIEKELSDNYLYLASAGSAEDSCRGAKTGFVWSLQECKEALESDKVQDKKIEKLLNNLNKNIVTDLAKEITVGVKDNTVSMDFIRAI